MPESAQVYHVVAIHVNGSFAWDSCLVPGSDLDITAPGPGHSSPYARRVAGDRDVKI